jgi:hypothetical protein
MMPVDEDEYTVEHPDQLTTILDGTLRLPSPTAYDSIFEEVKQGVETQSDECSIDITGLKFLNSSGLTALARIFLLARQKQKDLKIICSKDNPWQEKSIGSLKKLWTGIEVILK